MSGVKGKRIHRIRELKLSDEVMRRLELSGYKTVEQVHEANDGDLRSDLGKVASIKTRAAISAWMNDNNIDLDIEPQSTVDGPFPSNMLLVPVFRDSPSVEFVGWRIFLDGKEHRPEYLDEIQGGITASGSQQPNFLTGVGSYDGSVTDYAEMLKANLVNAARRVSETK